MIGSNYILEDLTGKMPVINGTH